MCILSLSASHRELEYCNYMWDALRPILDRALESRLDEECEKILRGLCQDPRVKGVDEQHMRKLFAQWRKIDLVPGQCKHTRVDQDGAIRRCKFGSSNGCHGYCQKHAHLWRPEMDYEDIRENEDNFDFDEAEPEVLPNFQLLKTSGS